MNANFVALGSQPQESSYMANSGQQINAFMMSPEGFVDLGWFVDSGATKHCTSASSSIQSKTSYHGNDQIYMKDGTGVNIFIIGIMIFFS